MVIMYLNNHLEAITNVRVRNIILTGIGVLLLIIGGIGIVIPVLPTTPFVIVAAFCFSVGNKKMESMLMKSKYFGSYIDNYKNKTGVPRHIKIRAIAFLWIGLIVSMFIVGKMFVIGILILVGIGVTWHILSLRTRK